jgi:hypothetical protein
MRRFNRYDRIVRVRNPVSYFADLPPSACETAAGWLVHFLQRTGPWLESWRLANYVGQARRLTRNPPTSAWGRSMLAKRGGYAVQEKYRREGRTGARHPAVRATAVSASRRRVRKKLREEAEWRKRMGLPPKSRVRWLPLD